MLFLGGGQRERGAGFFCCRVFATFRQPAPPPPFPVLPDQPLRFIFYTSTVGIFHRQKGGGRRGGTTPSIFVDSFFLFFPIFPFFFPCEVDIERPITKKKKKKKTEKRPSGKRASAERLLTLSSFQARYTLVAHSFPSDLSSSAEASRIPCPTRTRRRYEEEESAESRGPRGEGSRSASTGDGL